MIPASLEAAAATLTPAVDARREELLVGGMAEGRVQVGEQSMINMASCDDLGLARDARASEDLVELPEQLAKLAHLGRPKSCGPLALDLGEGLAGDCVRLAPPDEDALATCLREARSFVAARANAEPSDDPPRSLRSR